MDGHVSREIINHAVFTEEIGAVAPVRIWEWILCVFPDHRFEVEDATAEGQTVALRGTMVAHTRGRTDGHRAHWEACHRPAVALVPRYWTARWRSTGR